MTIIFIYLICIIFTGLLNHKQLLFPLLQLLTKGKNYVNIE